MKRLLKVILPLIIGLFMVTPSASYAADQKEKKAKKPKKERVQYIGTTGVPKAAPDVFLSLNGGIYTNHDKTNPSYAVCVQAYDRLPKKFDAKIGWVVTAKSGAEINMSEELFQHLLKEVEKSNAAIKHYTNYY